LKTTSYTQWYNENEGRKFPLAELATCASDTHEQLPNDVLADMGLLLPPAYEDAYVGSLCVTDTLVSLGIQTDSTGLLVGTWNRNDLVAYTAYPLTGLVDDVSGWIVFGNHLLRGRNIYRFSSATQSRISERAIRRVHPIPVKHFQLFEGRTDLYADRVVRFVGRGGIIVEAHESDPQTVVVRLSPDLWTQYLGPCNEVADDEACDVPPLRGFNGVCPDENGRITLRFE
jgi:hypothetical protein